MSNRIILKSAEIKVLESGRSEAELDFFFKLVRIGWGGGGGGLLELVSVHCETQMQLLIFKVV